MDICKTDVRKIIKYLDDSAMIYDSMQGLGMRYTCRAQMLRRLSKKLNNKLLKDKENDKTTTH